MQAVGSTDAATLLLVDSIRLAPQDQVLILSVGDPALPIFAARQAASVDVYDLENSVLARAQEHVAARLGDDQLPNQNGQSQRLRFHQTVYPPPGSDFDVAIVTAPVVRAFARAQLISAFRALRPGGRLYIAGPSQGAAKTMLDDAAQLFGRSVTLSTRRRCRVGVAVRPQHVDDALKIPGAWIGDGDTSAAVANPDPTQPQPGQVETPFGSIAIASMPGVPSGESTDAASMFLLETLSAELAKSGPSGAAGESVLSPWHVLHVGCGTGLLGLAVANQAARVVFTDDNLLAVLCARAGIALNGLHHAEALPANIFARYDTATDQTLPGQPFDLILAHPPYQKIYDPATNITHQIIRGAKSVLASSGRLIMVTNAAFNYTEVMEKHLTEVRVLASNAHDIVIEGRR